MNEKPLDKPIVADMIELLKTYPQDAALRIEDADTNWHISIIHHELIKDTVILSGRYGEMN